MSRTLLGAALVLCAACAGAGWPLSRDPLAAEAELGGFPSQKLDGLVFAAARWDERHDEVFGIDLTDAAKVLPIALAVRLRGEGQDEARAWLNPERMAPELVLADGTTLGAVAARDVALRVPERFADRVERGALATGLLSPRGEEGWLFFDLSGLAEGSVGSRWIEHAARGRTRRLAIAASLVRFQVTFDGDERDVCVGVAP